MTEVKRGAVVKPAPRIDAVGRRYGRLTVTTDFRWYVSPQGARVLQRVCICDCGGVAYASIGSLKSGNTKSCGCLAREMLTERATHGASGRRTFNIWCLMRKRCDDKRDPAYGGRGISYCDRWGKYEHFVADMGEAPDGLSLERKNNDGGYEPGNCRWATQKEQCRNRRSSRSLTVRGQTHTIVEWAERTGVSRRTIMSRIRLGWDAERAITAPIVYPSYDRSNMGCSRKGVPLLTKLACALLHVKNADGSWLIPESLRGKEAADIVRHVQWDHNIPHAIGGGDTPQNLQPLPKADHLEKTKLDVSSIAKGKRLSKAEEDFRRRLLAKVGQSEPGPEHPKKRKKQWPKGRKIQSQGFPKRSKAPRQGL